MRTNCEVCGEALACTWTDTHGVAQCVRCGSPYRVFHYESDKRVDKPAELLIAPQWLAAVKAYWKEIGKPLGPEGFSFPGGQGIGNSRAFYDWCDAHPNDIPAAEDR